MYQRILVVRALALSLLARRATTRSPRVCCRRNPVRYMSECSSPCTIGFVSIKLNLRNPIPVRAIADPLQRAAIQHGRWLFYPAPMKTNDILKPSTLNHGYFSRTCQANLASQQKPGKVIIGLSYASLSSVIVVRRLGRYILRLNTHFPRIQ